MPESQTLHVNDYERIEASIRFVESRRLAQPGLAQIARHVGLSESHFQRLFSRWAGISPKRFLKFLTLEHAKRSLADSKSVLDAALDSGLSGPGRLHDLFVSVEGVTPGEFKAQGAGLTITHGFHASPFGECLIAATARGLCGLSFVGQGGRAEAREDLASRWPRAKLVENARLTRPIFLRVFGRAVRSNRTGPLRVLLKGTPFQIKVWQAILRIPPGCVVSYEDVARAAGRPGGSRAVGQALGMNPVAYLVPCHRVIRASGLIEGYRWGSARKQSMLAWEAAHREKLVAGVQAAGAGAPRSRTSTRQSRPAPRPARGAEPPREYDKEVRSEDGAVITPVSARSNASAGTARLRAMR